MDALKEAVLAGDSGAIALARPAGPSAAPVLRELARHADPGVRVVALLAVTELGGGEALEACRAAATDGHPQVRAASLRGLDLLLDAGRAAVLLELLASSGDPETRRQLALAYGRREKVDPAPLRKRRESEKDPVAAEGLAVALARLGDRDAQAEFSRLFQAATEPDARLRFLEYAAEMRAPWVLRAVGPALDDATPLVRIGTDGRGEVPEYLRACDVAVNLIAALSGKRLSFAPGKAVAYPPAAVDEARRVLQSMPSVG
jgi:hypothetical protein